MRASWTVRRAVVIVCVGKIEDLSENGGFCFFFQTAMERKHSLLRAMKIDSQASKKGKILREHSGKVCFHRNSEHTVYNAFVNPLPEHRYPVAVKQRPFPGCKTQNDSDQPVRD